MRLPIRSKSNYSILSSSPFLASSLIRRIVYENSVAGVLSYPNMFQPYVVVSDSADPGQNRWVISRVGRSNFEAVDVDKSWLEVFYLLNNASDKSLFNYLSHSTKVKRLALVDRYALFLLLLMKPYDNLGFNANAADDVCGRYMEKVDFNYFDCIKTVVSFLNCPSQPNYVSLVKKFPDDRYPLFCSIVNLLVDNDIPGMLHAEISDLLGMNFRMSLRSLSLFMLKNNASYEACFLQAASMVKSHV